MTNRKLSGETMADLDGNNDVDAVDLFLAISGFFAFAFSLLLCWMCWDCFDRSRRNRNIELGKDVPMEEYQYDHERQQDSETSDSDDERDEIEDYQGIIITSGRQIIA